MKRGLLTELSRLTGFSKTTVSRVLSGKADKYRVSGETESLILSIAKLLDDDGSAGAQRLRNNLGRTIGLAVPSISNPFFANLSAAIIAEAHKYDFSVSIFDTQETGTLELQALADMRQRQVDGIIIVPCSERTDALEAVSLKTPTLLVDRYFKRSRLPYIATNNYDGGYMAMKELIHAGHRSILCIEGPAVSVTTRERERGCKAAVRDMGEACAVYYRGNEFSIDNGYLQTRLATLLNPRPTAIFAMSNTILLGALQALRELRLSVPGDMSIISFDDFSFLDYLDPPVSRIAQPLKGIGRTAVKIMADCIEHGRVLNSQILMSPTLIRRGSVAQP